MSTQVKPPPRPLKPPKPPKGLPRSLSRVGSAAPSRIGTIPRRLPPRLTPRAQTPRHSPAPVQTPSARCKNPECDNPQVEEVDGQQTCLNCGATVADSNIVSEVTFGESSTGAAVVQGGRVDEGQTHARTLGPAFKRGAQTNSRQLSEGNGRDEIRKLATFMKINQDFIIDEAVQIYILAVGQNFIVGRRVITVAAVCLYTACRRKEAGRESTVLLIDFAEAIRVNVFRLGKIYQAMCKTFFLTNNSKINPSDKPADSTISAEPLIEVEDLIQRYAQKLEFGNKTQRVANDAAKIVKRMKRDWMVTGRQPSGLCGAAIILAARMNNFRRTVREVVYVVKVHDVTVGKRLEEFQRTDSSALSVEEFRKHGLRLKKQHDPPVLREARLKEARKRKLHAMRNGPRGNPDQVEEQQPTDDAENPAKRLRRDAEGFAIPPRPVPVDPALDDVVSSLGLAGVDEIADDGARTPRGSLSPGPYRNEAKANRARKPPKSKKRQINVMDRPEMKILTAEDLVDEDSLEKEIKDKMNDREFQEQFNDVKYNYFADRAKQAALEVRTAERESRRQETEKRRQQAGLLIDLSANDSDDGSDADDNAEQPFDRRSSRSSTVPPRPSSRSPSVAPGARQTLSALPDERRTARRRLTPTITQSPRAQTPQRSARNASPDEPMISGGLITPPATQSQSSQASQHRSSTPQRSPELVTPATTQAPATATPQSNTGKQRTLGRWDISSDPEISPSEFDEDPEVKYCMLTEADKATKEIIWVTENEQWLRQQQSKALRQAMIEARRPRRREGSATGGEEPVEYYGGRPKTKKKRGRMGDGAILEEGGKPKTAAEAAHRMINKRGKGFSKWTNKKLLDDHMKALYQVRRSSSNGPTTSGDTSSVGAGTREQSEAPSNAGSEASVTTNNDQVENEARRGTEDTAMGQDANRDEPTVAGKEPTAAEQDNPEQVNIVNNNDTAEPEAEDADAEDGDAEEDEDEEMNDADEGLDEMAAEFGEEDENVQYYEDDDDMGFEGDEDYE